jgi:hypothetical protein
MKSANPASRVFSVSGKDRAAVTLAGHSPDAAYWFKRAGHAQQLGGESPLHNLMEVKC